MPKSKETAERPKGAKPIYNARVKQNPDSDFMTTIGAAWPFNEGDGLVVSLTLIPTNWDGKFILYRRKTGTKTKLDMLMSKKISTHLKEAPVTTCVVTELGEYVERADKN